MNEYAETVIAQRLSTVTGVAQVNINGAQKFAVRIDLDPRELASRQIGIDQVAQAVAVRRTRTCRPARWPAREQSFVVEADGKLMSAAGYRPVVVAYRNGSPVRLHEVARVFDGVENDKTAAYQRTSRAVFVSIQRQPGANTVQIIDSIRALLPALRAQLPAAVNLDVRSDRSKSIRESVADVKFTLVLTMGLVVLVIFLFLRNVSATVIPSLALPVSVIGTFAVMYAFGYSLDNLSLMALTLAVGFVVDDAIVMLENIVRHMETGQVADGGGVRRLEGSGVHDPVDDRVAGGGVHPGAVHGRHRRPAAARVRGHDRGGHPGVGRRVGDADADAVQPVPEAARTKRRHGCAVPWRPSAMFDLVLAGYAWTLRQTLRFRPVAMAVSIGARGRHRTVLFTQGADGVHPERGHRARFRPRPRACRASASRRCGSTSCEAAEIVAADPNVASVAGMIQGGNQGRHVHRAQAARGARR